jgi:DivIVA domain-containing protein
MIDLTPIEIRKKKGDFPRSVRGYNVTEVDLFLELAADRLEEVVTQVRELEARTIQLEEQLGLYRQREKALTDALVSAEALREEMRLQAEREADLIRRSAEMDAEKLRSAAHQSVEREHELMRRLRARRVQALESFRHFLERELAELSVMAEVAAGELAAPAGGLWSESAALPPLGEVESDPAR